MILSCAYGSIRVWLHLDAQQWGEVPTAVKEPAGTAQNPKKDDANYGDFWVVDKPNTDNFAASVSDQSAQNQIRFPAGW